MELVLEASDSVLEEGAGHTHTRPAPSLHVRTRGTHELALCHEPLPRETLWRPPEYLWQWSMGGYCQQVSANVGEERREEGGGEGERSGGGGGGGEEGTSLG